MDDPTAADHEEPQHYSKPDLWPYTVPYQQLPSSSKGRRSLSDSQLKHAGRGNNRRASVGSELTANQRFNESQLLSAFARIGRPPFETSKKG